MNTAAAAQPHGDEAGEVGAEHHPLAAVPVADRRGDRGDHRRDGKTCEGEQADGGRPAVVVGVDGDCDQVGVRSR